MPHAGSESLTIGFMRIAAVLASLLMSISALAAPSPIAGAKQLIVVVSPEWNSVNAEMTRYELHGAKWQRVGVPQAVILGRSGLAWGSGLNHETGEGPMKHEGDGKSPAGVFPLGTSFGFAPRSNARLPYLQLRDTTECVDDVKSVHYNTIVDRAAVAAIDWSSSEKMRSIPVYEHGIVVLHNDPPKPGGGSCIFLHLVSPKNAPTSGCTSMPPAAMDALLKWLDPEQRPLLVQLPKAEYDRLRPLWQLP